MLERVELMDPDLYVESGYPHDVWTHMRREAPVYFYEGAGVQPFWAITRHADICEISRQPERFLVGPRLMILPDEFETPESGVRTVANMDLPDHRAYRRIASSWFTPRAVGALETRIREIARELIRSIAARDEEMGFDFVSRLAAPFPLRVMAEILGIPEEDEAIVARLTNETFAFGDDEYQGSRDDALKEMYLYLAELAAKRRRDPRNDLASLLANARIDGKPLPDRELISYYQVVATAGHETTKTTLAAGLLALVEHPSELRRLKQDPSLAASAVEEILRWVTPVIHFGRRATEDYELRGQKIRVGEDVCMFYASANRDEEVFDEPFSFRVDRTPNRHLSFGVGEHFCMGAHLARLKLRVFLEELVPRLESIELAGSVERLRSSFTGGIKHLPVRAVVGQA